MSMDERKLAELLHDAVADTPPPSFDEHDVARASERQRIRRRNAVVTGSAFGVVVLASATALGVALWTGQGTPGSVTSAESVDSGGNGNAAPYELPDEGAALPEQTERGEQQQDFPPESRKQGRPSDGNGGSSDSASTPSGCEQVDRELAAALAGELPDTANVKVDDALPVSWSCATNAPGAEFTVPGGVISVLLLRNDQLTAFNSRSGTAQADAPTSDGRQVLVLSTASGSSGTAPFASDLKRIATEIAKIY
jgi:hypothetical protein